MTAETPISGSSVSPLAAISMKIVGLVTILSALIDYLVLLLPPDLANPQWVLGLTTQLVDRGIVPLVGIALLLTGFWVERMATRGGRGGNLLLDLRFWSCALSSLLGVIFLVVVAVHILNVRTTSQEALAQVTREANQATTQLEQRLAGELNQQRQQLTLLFQDETLLQQAIETGQLPEEVRQFQDDPAALDQFLNERAQEAQQRIQSEIGNRREEADQQVRREAVKSAIRIASSGLLLA
ncbi:MAG: HpsJ family protein, partial [Cyanobacteria bacterium]|nr:HpsJ family protein [Cyanobacteriota bacterium]